MEIDNELSALRDCLLRRKLNYEAEIKHTEKLLMQLECSTLYFRLSARKKQYQAELESTIFELLKVDHALLEDRMKRFKIS
jgi:macrodomain Ter protein organizer (MatP/YcbG family)